MSGPRGGVGALPRALIHTTNGKGSIVPIFVCFQVKQGNGEENDYSNWWILQVKNKYLE